MVSDPELPAAAHLLGPEGRHLLAAGIGALGGELRSARSAQVVYRPGAEVTARYDAVIRWPGHAPVTEVVCVSATRDGAPPGSIPLRAGDLEVGMWRYPFDPHLPGLATAVTSRGAVALVGDVVGGEAALTVRSYRPGRRAVVHASGPAGEAYLKVVPPDELPTLVATHRLLWPTVPVPEVLATDDAAGIAVLRALPGEGLRPRLREGTLPWPDAGAVLGLLDRLASVRVPGWIGTVRPLHRDAARHLQALERTVPGGGAQLARLRAALVEGRPDPPAAPRHLVHGDLHEAQLLVDGSRITGLLDVDGTGVGERVDDLARLLGHLSSLALGAGRHRPAIDGYVEALRRRFAAVVDPGELALRTAVAVVGLATGPFRVQMPGWEAETRRRLALATRWLVAGQDAGAA